MEIKYDKRMWRILPILDERTNEHCPFLDYPYNIHRCNHPSFIPNGDGEGEDTECNMDICPIWVNCKICNCIRNIESGGEQFEKLFGKNDKDIRFNSNSAGLIYNKINSSFEIRTHSIIHISNGKREIKKELLHAYCPFCGRKYPEL